MAKGLTASKAKKILEDGTVRGKALTEKQKKFFGAVAGGATPLKKLNGGWLDKFAMGGSLPGASGMMYARTSGSSAMSPPNLTKAQDGFYKDIPEEVLKKESNFHKGFYKDTGSQDEGTPVTGSPGLINLDTVEYGTPEYKKAYEEGRFADVPNQLDEVVIYSGVDYEKYPYYNDLSAEQRKYFNDPGAIGRGVRRAAYTKRGLAEDTYDVVNPIMYGMLGLAGGMAAGPALSTLGRGAAPYVSRYALNPIQKALSYKPFRGPVSIGNAIDAGSAAYAAYATPEAYRQYQENPNFDTGSDLALTAVDLVPFGEIFTGGKNIRKAYNYTSDQISNIFKAKPKGINLETTPLRDAFTQPNIYPTSSPLPKSMEPYLSRRVYPFNKEQEIFESFLPIEAQLKNIDLKSIRYDADGNIIPNMEYGGEIDKAQWGKLLKLAKKYGSKAVDYLKGLRSEGQMVTNAANTTGNVKYLDELSYEAKKDIRDLNYKVQSKTDKETRKLGKPHVAQEEYGEGWKYSDEVDFNNPEEVAAHRKRWIDSQKKGNFLYQNRSFPLFDETSDIFTDLTRYDLNSFVGNSIDRPFATRLGNRFTSGLGEGTSYTIGGTLNPRPQDFLTQDVSIRSGEFDKAWKYDEPLKEKMDGEISRFFNSLYEPKTSKIDFGDLLKNKNRNGGEIPEAQFGKILKGAKNLYKKYKNSNIDNFEFKNLPTIEKQQLIKVVDGNFDAIDYDHLIPTQQEISDIAKRTRKRLLTDKFIKNNMEATGRSKDEILGYVDDYIKEFENSNLSFGKLDGTVDGLYTRGKITIDPTGPNLNKEKVLGVLEHEVEHMFSNVGQQGSDLYRHPKLKLVDDNPALNIEYLSRPWEQQVRFRKALNWLEKNAGLKAGDNVTDEQVAKLTDAIANWSKEAGKDFRGTGPNYDIHHLFSSLDAQQFLQPGQYLMPNAPKAANLKNSNVRKAIKDILNKTYSAAAVGGLGAASQMGPTQEDGEFKNGGDIPKAKDGGRCWPGYKTVAGKTPFSKGSCQKAQDGYMVPSRKGVRLNYDEQGNVIGESTHIMKAEQLEDGTWVGFPSLFQNEDGKWVDMSGEKDWMNIYNEALKRGEVIEFGKDKEAAIKFGEGSWKSPKMKDGGWLDKFQEGGVIEDDRGQWAYPGEVTKINSNNITMKGVNYPVLGVSDKGDAQMMYPNGEYQYDGNSVTEFPMARDGKSLVELNQLTNFTNYNTPQPGGWLDKYH